MMVLFEFFFTFMFSPSLFIAKGTFASRFSDVLQDELQPELCCEPTADGRKTFETHCPQH